MNQRDTLKINRLGHLEIGGVDTLELAKQYNTPLYVMDENYIEKMLDVFNKTIADNYGNGLVCYASKAFSAKEIYKIVDRHSCGVDVVSIGELFTALSAGFPPNKIVLHGCNKTYEEIKFAVDSGVYTIVVDGIEDIEYIDSVLTELNVQNFSVLLRTNPGVEAHTHHYIQTAKVDSKFGLSVKTGDAIKGIDAILNSKNLKLSGIHCHIGSQIFEHEPFILAVDVMTDLIKEVKDKFNFNLEVLNMGGGFGIYYTDKDKKIDVSGYADYVKSIITALNSAIEKKGIIKPFLIIEPGRSIVGEAGITLYTVGTIKDIAGIRKYVNIDGGMFDNPRYALYQAEYTPTIAGRANDAKSELVTIAGKCCESGDIIAKDVMLQSAKRGDVLAVFSTGAYNYSMASNYNRNFVPPVVMVKDGKSRLIVKKQTLDDIVRNDI